MMQLHRLVSPLAFGVLAAAACGPANRLEAQGGSPPALQDTVPAGYGSLRRDDILMRFATDQLQLQILPLDERVIRLLAPDTYRSLEQLINSRHADIAAAAERAGLSNPTLVLVTFYGQAPGARFTPEDVQIQSHGRLYRPQGIVPLSPTWNTLQLDQRQQAVAIYLYDEGISWYDDLTASYEGATAGSWSRSVRVLQQERARVQARAQTQPSPPSR
jgi:hypothetical protein